MRILICTQAVDRDDPILGFFHAWIEEFAKHVEKITVVCLRKGKYDLPDVEVIALGERAKFARAFEFLSIAFGRRGEYDAVFVMPSVNQAARRVSMSTARVVRMSTGSPVANGANTSSGQCHR